ncbi:hypothetical protein Zmor_015989 [Zophobas morio]|uniref:Cytochrome P450 n=2 Tax=Zophobas morio TaxID=2755281 RepID=A0AA38MH14_9CUCU|nr:hypothetical protein Zmor_015989 [Zophobas morio]
MAILVLSVLVLLLSLYFRLKKRQKNDGLNKFPEGPSHPLLGHLPLMTSTTDVIDVSMQLIRNHGKTVKIRIGPKILPMRTSLLTADSHLTEFILSGNKILKKTENYQFLKHWLRKGLLISDGDYWKRHRKILTPAFHLEVLKEFVQVFESVGDVLIEKLRRCEGTPSCDLHPFVTLCTLDVICETAMGTKMNVQSGKNSHYVQSVKKTCRIIIERSMSTLKLTDTTFWLCRDFYTLKNELKVLHDFTHNVINSKKNNKSIDKNTKRLAFLDLLLKFSQDENILSTDEIREEVDTFMFAGHDTTASGICFTLYCLADHPEVQKQALQEQKDLFGDEKNPVITYPDLQNMKYLEQVIKESCRLYPPVPIIGRYTTEDTEFDGCLIPKYTNIMLFIYGLHRDPDYFPEPEKFKPERFDNFDGSLSYTYIPFSAGSRSCIGQKFAMLEMKSIISKIVRHFEIKPTSPRHEVKLSAETVLKSLNGIKVTLKKRP